jgi:putative transposase
MSRREYPGDVTDEEWASLEPLIPAARPGGRPRTTDLREVINALLQSFPHGRPLESRAP